jgi:nucleotide-binding universal stress UspA family protein
MWSMAEASTRFDPPRMVSEREEEIEKTLMGYQEDINNLLDPVPLVKFQIISGDHAEKLVKKPKKKEIVLVLICRSNLTDKPFFSIDNINEQMLNDSQTPVIVHPPVKEFTGVRKIVYGTIFHSFDVPVLKKLSELFDKENTEINVLHITDDSNFEKKLIEAGYAKTVSSKIKNKNLNISTMIAREKASISNHIQAYANDQDADIIAILKKRTDFLERETQRSVSDELVTDSELPLMVFPVT